MTNRTRIGIFDQGNGCLREIRERLSGDARFEAVILKSVAGMPAPEDGGAMPELMVACLGNDNSETAMGHLRRALAVFKQMDLVAIITDEKGVLPSFEAGAKGCILDSRLEALPDLLEKILAGQTAITPDIGEILIRQIKEQFNRLESAKLTQALSDREKQVLALHQQGLSREKVGEQLGISYFTVRRHIQNALDKTGTSSVKNLLEMAAFEASPLAPLQA